MEEEVKLRDLAILREHLEKCISSSEHCEVRLDDICVETNSSTDGAKLPTYRRSLSNCRVTDTGGGVGSLELDATGYDR